MKKTILVVSLLAVVAAGLAAGAADAPTVTTTELLRHPAKFDGQTVRVAGAFVNVSRPETARAARCRFNVVAAGKAVSVLCQAPPSCVAGVVEGVFRSVRVDGGTTLYNAVKATTVTCGAPDAR